MSEADARVLYARVIDRVLIAVGPLLESAGHNEKTILRLRSLWVKNFSEHCERDYNLRSLIPGDQTITSKCDPTTSVFSKRNDTSNLSGIQNVNTFSKLLMMSDERVVDPSGRVNPTQPFITRKRKLLNESTTSSATNNKSSPPVSGFQMAKRSRRSIPTVETYSKNGTNCNHNIVACNNAQPLLNNTAIAVPLIDNSISMPFHVQNVIHPLPLPIPLPIPLHIKNEVSNVSSSLCTTDNFMNDVGEHLENSLGTKFGADSISNLLNSTPPSDGILDTKDIETKLSTEFDDSFMNEVYSHISCSNTKVNKSNNLSVLLEKSKAKCVVNNKNENNSDNDGVDDDVVIGSDYDCSDEEYILSQEAAWENSSKNRIACLHSTVTKVDDSKNTKLSNENSSKFIKQQMQPTQENISHRWICNLHAGIVRIDGADFVFNSGKGIFIWE